MSQLWIPCYSCDWTEAYGDFWETLPQNVGKYNVFTTSAEVVWVRMFSVRLWCGFWGDRKGCEQSKFDKRTAGGERSLPRHLSSLKDPSVEPEQVSAEQLSPSLGGNKLWTYSSKGASVSVEVIAQLAFFIHRWRLPSSSLEPVCLRWQSFNQTAQCLRCVLRILLAPHFPVCQYSINAPSRVLPPSEILWKGVAGSDSVRCSFGRISYLIYDEDQIWPNPGPRQDFWEGK